MYGDLARKVDSAVPYASMALNTVPLLAPEYAESAMQKDESLGSDSMGLKAVPYVANTADSIAVKVNTVLPYKKFCDLQTSSKYITAERTQTYNPDINKTGYKIVSAVV